MFHIFNNSLIFILLFHCYNTENTKYFKEPDLSTFVTNVGSDPTKKISFIKSCKDADDARIYWTRIPGIKEKTTILCDGEFNGGGWTILQRRSSGDLNFHQDWASYKKGFGDLSGEFWYGLEKIYRLLQSTQYEVMMVMKNSEDVYTYAAYSRFLIGSEYMNYTLKAIGRFAGEAGNSMQYHLNMPFSTYDQKNNAKGKGNCSKLFWGGWWFNNCYTSNLNGKYPNTTKTNRRCFRCIAWNSFTPDSPLVFTQIMIRHLIPKNWQYINNVYT